MTTKSSYSDNQPMNEKTMEKIAQRVADFKKNKDKSKHNADEVESHIGALSEVFELEKGEVELIAKDVIIKKEQQNNLKDHVYDGLIKYGKQVIAIIIVSIIVSFLLLGRSVVQPQNQPVAYVNTVEPDYSMMVKKAHLSSIFAAISPVKHEVAQYYLFEGEFPLSLDFAGINESDMKEINGIDGFVFNKKGEIIIKTGKSIGENVVLKLSPKAVGGYYLQWKCHTNFPGYFPSCDRVNMDQELKYFK